MKVSLNEAAKLIKKSKGRVIADLKSGILSGEQDPITKYWSIPITEIYRCYGNITGSVETTKNSKEKSSSSLVEDQINQLVPPNKTETTLIKLLQEQLLKTEQRLEVIENRLEEERLKNDRLINQILLTHQPETVHKKRMSIIWIILVSVITLLGFYLVKNL